MHKSILFAAVGVTVFLAGCPDDVMNDVYYRPAPGGADIQQPAPEPAAMPEQIAEPAPAPAPAAPAVSALKYAPMTDVVSSGGVDSVSGKKASCKSGSYIVKRGDTPEKIARKHGVRLSALMSVNNLTQESARKLQIGQKLVIPGKSAKNCPAAGGKKSVKSVKSVKNDTPAPALEGGKYSVKSGDTPERIARRYKVKLSDLLRANNMDEAAARRLQIGQKLIIPGQDTAPAAPVAPEVEATATVGQAPSAPAVDSNAPAENVQTGDAAAVPSTAPAVDSNAPANTEALSDYDAVEIENDSTFAEIAAKYNISEAELRKANGGNTEEKVKKGDLIIVPKKKN